MNIAEDLLKETDTLQAKEDLCISYEYMGSVLEALNKLKYARRWYLKLVMLREELVNKDRSKVNKALLSEAYERLGKVTEAMGDSVEAKKWFDKC